MDESEDNMSVEDIQSLDSPLFVKLKPKKRSLVERELETNLTARVTSPVTAEGTSTSRYGRARRLKTEAELDAEKAMKPLRIDTSKSQPQAYKMHASNSPIRKESPKQAASAARSIEDQIENIYNENMSLSRFGSEEQVKALSPAKKFPKVYIRKDLTQKPDTDTSALIKNVFSPVKKSNTHLNNILERSSEKYSLNGHGRLQNGFLDSSSVVKTLDFDGKKKKDVNEKTIAKNELFESEAGCEYQVGDLAWARVGSYPFWPCIVTREPFTELFVKKKVFGRVEHDVVHVTFFGDNGRRGWIVDNLLRKYLGRAEFESSRYKFTPEAKKKDPRLYAAHFVSEKKLPLWNISVEEAEAMLREPKRLRIDILYELLEQGRVTKTTPKREKGGKIMRTDSDVSLSESLYDTLFSEDDAKTDENNRSKKPRKKSLDVSEVVTACLDNMAAKSGIIQIQKQSHMDRWLQKAKSKTPEKTQPKYQTKSDKKKDGMKKKSKELRRIKKNKCLSAEANLTSYQNEHDYSSVNYENHDINEGSNKNTNFEENGYDNMADNSGIGIISKIDSLSSSIEDYNQDDIITTVVSDDIVINGSVNKNIEVIDDNVTKSEEIEDSLQDISVSNPNNSINTTKNEQIKTKIHSAQKKKKKAKVAIETNIVINGSLNKNIEAIDDNVTKSEEVEDNLQDISMTNPNNSINTTKKEQIKTNIDSAQKKKKKAKVAIETNIVINGSVDKNIEVIDDNVTKSEEIEDNLQDISVTNPNNGINTTKNELIKTKIDSAQKKKKKAKVAIETRRSKRKRLSVEEDNNILKDMKPDKKIKKSLPNLDDTQIDISLITDMSDVENMNKDSFQDVLSNEILDSGELKCNFKEGERVVPSDVGKDTLKSKESTQNELTQLNDQKAIVVIEQLKMSSLETMFIKESNVQDEVLQNEDKPEDKFKKNIDKTESLVTDDLENNTSKTTVSEPMLNVAKNVTKRKSVVIKEELHSVEADKKIKDKEIVLNEDVLNDKGILEKKIDEFDKMDVDDQNMNNNKEKQKDCLNSTDFVSKNAETNPRPSKKSKTMKPHKFDSSKVPIQSENNVASNVVTDDPEFMKYLELRQDAVRDEQPELSQDEIVTYLHQTWLYEESNKSDRKKTDDAEQSNIVKGLKPKATPPPKKTKKKCKAAKECKSEIVPIELGTKNVVIGEEMYIFDRTLSQDYDEITEDVLNVISNSPIDSSINEGQNKDLLNLDGDLNVNGDYEPTFTQDYDKIGKAVDIKEKLSASQGDSSSNKEDSCSLTMIRETDCDKVACDDPFFYKDNSKSKKKKRKLNADTCTKPSTEDIPILNKDTCIKSDQKIVEQINPELDTVEQNVETSVNNQETNELKEKKRKSPKLSLNRTKNASANIQVSDLKNNTTESPVNIFLDTPPDGDRAPREDLKNDLAEPDCDVKLQKLIETKKNIHKVNGLVESKESTPERKLRDEFDPESASIKSEDSGVSTTRRKIRAKEKQDVKKAMDDPEFIKYLEFRQDALIDEQPELSQEEIVTYLYQTWLYEESNKSDQKKTDDVEQSNLVKGLNQEIVPQPKKIKKKPKVEKERDLGIISSESTELDIIPKEKTKRKTQSKPCYNEDFSDLEEEDLETFNIFDPEEKPLTENGEQIDEVELYFEKLTKPKPNVFKGFSREKVCEICELTENLIKCKSCHGTFHVDCVKNEEQLTEVSAPTRGRKKKKKPRGRKPKGYYESLMDSGSQSDERSQDASISEDFDMSIEDETESHITVDAENFEVQWELKMKELTPENEEEYESGQEVYWDAPPGQCEIVDIKRKERPVDYSDFKCNNCHKYDTPLCFVCKSDKSPKALNEVRQKCHVAHCHRYYHLECLEYWPQTQFNSWEPSKTNKKVIECVEALSCPRHVCHTCVSDDPRGCKTRFCGDKLARCVKCPATYHSFTKCLPAGTQILTASQIICPRHCEHRAGQVPRHVNTGWCFICALGGTLICCEYCPTSFHAECLNIKPPEGSYMCEDCETGRLPLYGEMVWVKLGHYRWWPGIILHPCEIPDNILAVKHSPGEFVVRFFGQYDHYWVNRGRVFPFQEGDSGKISSQKSKIDAAFTTAMEHAQRACEILKNVEPNEEEEEDIASSLLPPHYVKLKANKPAGSLPARRDIDANSLTQCDCDPKQPDPCGPYSHCLNRMLLTECGPLCRAGERCNNRAFEKRLYPRLAPHRAPARGWGLRALEDIKQGQFVIEYVGELIDEEEFRRRMCRKHEVRDENFYFLTLDKERMIDAGPKGNLARFMNHCCEPNCETQKWTVLGDVRVGLFALRDIPANSEVTFNYNLECAGIEKKRCLCGAKRCSGYIGAKPKQEEAQPKKIKVPAKRTYKKRKNVEDSPSTSKTKPPNKIKITKPIKPRELTEIEKDLLIIKNATNGMSSDSEGSRLSSVDEKKDPKALKRKRVSFSTEEVFSNSSGKKLKFDDTSAKVTE